METREQRYLELITENGTQRVLNFEPGRDTGVWCLAGDGALRPAGPHVDGPRVFLRFYGARLFVGTTWDELQASSTINVGGLKIGYRVGPAPAPRNRDADEEATAIRAPPLAVLAQMPNLGSPPSAASPLPSSSRQPAATPRPSPMSELGDDKTRVFSPLSLPPSPALPTPRATAVARSLEASPPRPLVDPAPAIDLKRGRSDDETRVGPPPDVRSRKGGPTVLAPLQTTPAPAAPAAKPKAGIRVTPIQGGILGLMALVVVMVTVGTSRKNVHTVPQASKTSVAAPRASVPVGLSAASTPGSTAAPSSPSGAPSSDSSPTPAPVAPLSSTSVASSASVPTASSPPPGIHDERAAVLAVESGATDRAARLYDGLASAHPDRPAYREAARILRAKSAQ
jgi:hypothetical protein